MKSALSIAAWLLLTLPLFSQDIVLEIQGSDVQKIQVTKFVEVKEDALVVKSFPFTVKAPLGADSYRWKVSTGVKVVGDIEDDTASSLQVLDAPKGLTLISVRAKFIDFDAKKIVTKVGKSTFYIQSVDPAPPAPPGPDPKPPTPDPNPVNPAPIPYPGFRVLIIEDKSERASLPPLQLSQLSDKRLHDYLDQVCVKIPGENPWWIVDKDVSFMVVKNGKMWQDALALKRESLPWIIISDGVTGTSQALPLTVQETLNLIKKYAERKGGANRGY